MKEEAFTFNASGQEGNLQRGGEKKAAQRQRVEKLKQGGLETSFKVYSLHAKHPSKRKVPAES